MGHQLNCTRLILITELILQPTYAVSWFMDAGTNLRALRHSEDEQDIDVWCRPDVLTGVLTNVANILR